MDSLAVIGGSYQRSSRSIAHRQAASISRSRDLDFRSGVTGINALGDAKHIQFSPTRRSATIAIIMAIPSVKEGLTNTVLSFRLPAEAIQDLTRQIHQNMLAHSRHIRLADIRAIHPEDLEFLFGAYDERFLASNCRLALNGRRLRFRLAPRMTSAGGKTTKFTTRTGKSYFEIAIASSMLFDGFANMDRRISVSGIDCENRLEALQRIFEHELVHLIELLCWETSNCHLDRFQEIVRRLFLHRTHTHNLITRRERAADSGIRQGSRVTFEFEGLRLRGRVNRVTKRATVLVEDLAGKKYSDGLRYKTYYVPIARLLAE